MKILAVNGSPRGKASNTDRIIQPFLEGAREAGAEAEVVYLKDKHIEPCKGCFNCWAKTPGVCIHQDDMPGLLEKFNAADIIIFGTPLYVFTVTGLMKDFMDRMIPILQPFILEINGAYVHPRRYKEGWPKKYVLISNCGFPERHHFSGLVETFRCFTSGTDVELAGTILCSCGELLKQDRLQEGLAWYTDAARKAGQEIVTQGKIASETQAILDRPLVEASVYANMANNNWRSHGVELIGNIETTSAQKAQPGTLLPPPQSLDDIRDLIAGMAMSYDPQAAGDLQAVIQFNVSGDGEETYYLDIDRASCSAYEGVHPEPTLIINTPADVWMKISRGEMNGATAMMTGKYSAKGSIGLLMKMNKLFSAAPTS